MIVKTKSVIWFGASAITVYPFIFVHPALANDEAIMKHEQVHCEQQKRWATYGVGIGLLAWFFLYSLCLPIGYNPFRRKWETEAYQKGQGYDLDTINEILKHAPYYLK